ncbi:MerR family transcriptional regulator [Amycolatopsis suaedae]|uniref:MerR family transcriptional regulator n=1 Tax=Amycolatopsis suaedae TaxID=2510978 RepID=A0A4Q7J770_9PSEU|nr:MerR family transcriptional regulator [Amycolatopsis suaedae]
MHIGELSERTGTTPRMLRYYEQQGLLKPQRTEGRFRTYAETDVQRVRRIRCLLAAALPIAVIAKVLACRDGALPTDPETCEPLLDVLQRQLDAINEKIGDLHTSREALERLMRDLHAGLETAVP